MQSLDYELCVECGRYAAVTITGRCETCRPLPDAPESTASDVDPLSFDEDSDRLLDLLQNWRWMERERIRLQREYGRG